MAVRLAKEARSNFLETSNASSDLPCLVAGSLSTHPPALPPGSSDSTLATYPTPDIEALNYIQAANAIEKSGVDILFLEMIKNLDHGSLAIAAAAQTSLPIALGISTRILSDGRIVLWGNGQDEIEFDKETFYHFVRLCGDRLVLVNIMHTNFSAMLPTLKLIRSWGWSGNLGCYPDHGRWASPHWHYEAVELPEAVGLVQEWVTQCGVCMVGGCCGLGPDYIAAITTHFRTNKR